MRINSKMSPNAIVEAVTPTDDLTLVRMKSLVEGLFTVTFDVQATHPVSEMFVVGQTVALTMDLGEPPEPPDDGLSVERVSPRPTRPSPNTAVRAPGAIDAITTVDGTMQVYRSTQTVPDELPINVATPGFPSQPMDKVREYLGIAERPVPSGPATGTLHHSEE